MNIQDLSGRFTIKALCPAHMRTLLKVYLYLQDQQGFSVVIMTTKGTLDFFFLNANIYYLCQISKSINGTITVPIGTHVGKVNVTKSIYLCSRKVE